MSREEAIGKAQAAARDSKSNHRIAALEGALNDVEQEAHEALPAHSIEANPQDVARIVLSHAFRVACPAILKAPEKEKLNPSLQAVQSISRNEMKDVFLDALT